MASRQSRLQEDTYFRVMKVLEEYPETTQRELAAKLGLSLGGINYCLTALVEKGFVKAKNFSKNHRKINYAYLLTPKCIKEKTALTCIFLQRKLQEYEDLRLEIDGLKLKVGVDRRTTKFPSPKAAV
jgi:EPS-associated MarR family transcriptional regulator